MYFDGVTSDDRILGAIEAIYDAALDDKRWPHALERLAHVTGSQAATFWVLDSSEQPRLPTFTSINFDPDFIAEYLRNFAADDPTVQYLVAHPNQSVVHDGLVITEREKRRNAYYDWHARHSDTRFRLIGQIRTAPAIQAGIALHRTQKNGRYEPADIALFKLLHPHVERSLAIGFRVGSLGSVQHASVEVLDRSSTAIVMLNWHGRLVYSNGAAQSLCATGDGIRISEECLTLNRKADNDRLQSLIRKALEVSSAGLPSAEAGMQALRPSGRRPYSILVSPLARQSSLLPTLRPAVCITVTDPSVQRSLSPTLVAESFDLTPAEARLAALLVEGEPLRSAADILRIRYGTARARLAEIFRKTETHRQSELIALLLKATR